MKHRVVSALTAIALSYPGVTFAAETGTIQGWLVDSRNQVKATGRAAVFVCDPVTGYPLVAKTRESLGKGISVQELKELWHVVTELDGSFEIPDVPSGSYRLVAQSWGGTEGVPGRKQSSEILVLHGSSDAIEVREGMTAHAAIRAMGEGSLKVVNDPAEPNAYLIVSTAPMLGDPILSYLGWGDEFLKNAVGITHMSQARMTILGLPEERDVSIATFHYDNVPGFGGGQFRAGQDVVARISIYAGWSNGKDNPPANLLPFVEYLEKHNPPLPETMKLGTSTDFQSERGGLDRRKLWDAIRANADKIVEIEDVGKTRVIDIAAADSYRKLRAHHKEQRERRK